MSAIDWEALGDEAVELRRRYHGYGFSPFVLDHGELGRIHGNDERISLDNLRAGARAYTEMLLAVC